jgi:mRNA interferase HicA
MKRTNLIRKQDEAGCVFVRHGGNHDWYSNPKTGASQPVPRHREINEFLAKHILKYLAS